MASYLKTVILPGNPPLEIYVRRSPTAKSARLRILQRSGGKIEISVPEFYTVNDAKKFARSQEDWIRKSLKQIPPTCRPHFGMRFPVEGKMLTISPCVGGRIIRTETELRVPYFSDTVAERILSWCTQLASERTKNAATKFVARLECPDSVRKISIKDPVSRWGSCSSKGNLMVSWRLIMAPIDVLDYVVAHEVAHLKEMNHSSRFWNTLEEIYPNYIEPQNWLKRNGAQLHLYDFSGN